MDFEDFLGPKANVVELRGQDRWQAIEELINHLVTARKIPTQHRDAIVGNVRTRESRMSTGIGFGIGIPHASTELVPEVVAVVGRSRKGIQFDALDGKPVHLVFLFLVPAGQFQKHANTLANIAKQLHRRDFRDGLWGRFM
jgi:mannitol/fructose-specific phosphotransferase system IIA component (Ntr-type)